MTTRRRPVRTNERGQTTVALGGVMAVALLLVGLVAAYGSAAVHRARSRTAADAVALAAAVDSDVAAELRSWYGSRGIVVESVEGRSVASSGPAQAAAWAGLDDGSVTTAPAMVAILARAEQLLGVQLVVVGSNDIVVTLSLADAAALQPIAAELGLCRVPPASTDAPVQEFELC